MAEHPLSRRIRDVLDLRPDGPAVEYDGEWLTWGEVAAFARRIESLDVSGRPGRNPVAQHARLTSQRFSAC